MFLVLLCPTLSAYYCQINFLFMRRPPVHLSLQEILIISHIDHYRLTTCVLASCLMLTASKLLPEWLFSYMQVIAQFRIFQCLPVSCRTSSSMLAELTRPFLSSCSSAYPILCSLMLPPCAMSYSPVFIPLSL